MLRIWLGIALALGMGCSVFDPSLIEDGGVPTDTSTDVVIPDDRDLPDTPPSVVCADGQNILPAPRPTETGDGDELVFGLKDVQLDQSASNGWRRIGFNIDGLCSEELGPVAECVPPDREAEPLVDGEGGIDNAFGAEFFDLIEIISPGLEETSILSANNGNGVILVRIRGWNGEANDGRVEVDISQSVVGRPGTAAQTEAPAHVIRDFTLYEADGTTEAPRPNWDGNDWLWVREENFINEDLNLPQIQDDNAYVADNTLYVRLPGLIQIQFAGENRGVKVALSDGYLFAQISEDRTQLVDATFAGRWSIRNLLGTARSVGVCSDEPSYNILLNKLNRIADVRATPGTGGADIECDAISVGVRFQGFRTRIGGVTPGFQPPDECTDE